MSAPSQKDLLVLLVHPERDPGCLKRSGDFLRSRVARYHHALVVFDREGCGDERDAVARRALLGGVL